MIETIFPEGNVILNSWERNINYPEVWNTRAVARRAFRSIERKDDKCENRPRYFAEQRNKAIVDGNEKRLK